ncbi:hypothetical protein [Ottowia sp.]|uniref:hypothetical protein n=1 Tax=Ottowia sp. TaxID=1898956 RepID=UPI0025E67140|nr:hypothetical protein [Ottowia sp.]MBK6616336.1 hypothetical protein [Ottowia sp.]
MPPASDGAGWNVLHPTPSPGQMPRLENETSTHAGRTTAGYGAWQRPASDRLILPEADLSHFANPQATQPSMSFSHSSPAFQAGDHAA